MRHGRTRERCQKFAFRIEATVQSYIDVQSVKPTSIKRSGAVAQIFEGLAKQGGFSFENNGVKIKLRNPYLKRVARHTNARISRTRWSQWIIDKGVLANGQLANLVKGFASNIAAKGNGWVSTV